MTSAILTDVTGESTMTGDAAVLPLPPTQRDMADLIAGGGVSYHPPTAAYYVIDGHTIGGSMITHSRGRALREMRKAGLISVGESADPQARVPVALTAEGRRRHTAP